MEANEWIQLKNLKVEIEPIKKTQPEGNLEVKKLGILTETTETSFTNRIQEMKEKISWDKDMIDNMDISVKENVEYKNSCHFWQLPS